MPHKRLTALARVVFAGVALLVWVAGCQSDQLTAGAQTARVALSPTPVLPDGLQTSSPAQERPGGAGGPTAEAAPSSESSLPPAISQYQFVVDLDYSQHVANVSQTVAVTNNSPDTWTELVFQAPVSRVPGALQIGAFTWPDAATSAATTYDPATLTYHVELPQPLPPRQTTRLRIDYRIKAPPITLQDWPPTGNVGYGAQIIQFGNWYPVLAPYRPGQGWYTWKFTEVGDPYVSDTASFDLEVRTSQPLTIVSAGEMQTLPGVSNFHLDRARDVAFGASPAYQSACRQIAEVKVCSYFLPEHATAGQDVLTAAVQSLQLFARLYGPYPYSSLNIAEDAFFGSMEYTGFVLHSGAGYAGYDGTPSSMLIALTAHEVAHQWWYSLVGTDQVAEPWLDEGLAMYGELAFYREYYPGLEDWYWKTRVYVYNPSGPLNRSIYDFPDSQTYVHQLYRRGVLFLEDLHKAMGDDAFYAFLRDVRGRYEFRSLTTDDFFNTLAQHNGSNYQGLVEAYFPGRASQAGSSPSPMSGVIYTVQAGDTLVGIAAKFNVTVEQIKALNHLTGDLIFAGQQLAIPAH